MKMLFALLLAGTVSVYAQTESPHWNTPGAGNPFIPGYFADPTIRKFGDTYYLYATTDGTGNGYGPAQVWVSYDFVNWRNIVMNWPTTEVVWAPDVIQAADGSYRYFYCEPCVVHEGIGQSPIGPWENVLGKTDAVLVPDRYVHNAITLDPQTFVDDDGSTYLYFGTWGIYKGFGCGVARFDASLKSFTDKKLIPNTEITDFFEAPYVFKRNGTYYFTYSSGSCHDHTYRVQYATSKAGPMGPFEYQGCILETNADQTVHGPGHHSILVEDGRYYIVYHRHNLPRSVHGFNRQVCIDELTFDDEGNIRPVNPTHKCQLPTAVNHQSKEMNLAFGAKVTASSHYDDCFRPDYAVDDNNATLWKARTTGEAWLQIDLGRAERFSEVWTQFEYATFFYQYKIETSIDGCQWYLFADRTQNTTQGSPMIDRTPSSKSGRKALTKARYLRITITGTQKNGHMPAIWNVKVWKHAPRLPYDDLSAMSSSSSSSSPSFPSSSSDASSYPGMHQQDVTPLERRQQSSAAIHLSAAALAHDSTAPFDVTTIPTVADNPFSANKPIRVRVKDGRWAFFFNGTQMLTSQRPLPGIYCYNGPYSVAFWALQTETGPVSTVVSLSSSRADLATTEIRLGTNPQTGLVNHNGSFESYGTPDAVKSSEGAWHHWAVTFDGWMERVYLDGQLLREQNNFLMIRPEGHLCIGADASGTNNYKGYLSDLLITPWAITQSEVERLFAEQRDSSLPSLGDDDFEEIDPDSRFQLSPSMKPVFRKDEPFTLSAQTADFNDDPVNNGATLCKTLQGDFVVMAHVDNMEGLAQHAITSYNEGGIIACADGGDVYYQLGAFPLYNCGNMFTVLSPRGRPQFPNYKGFDFDPFLQLERRGALLYARTSRDGQSWTNMPGSPVDVGSGPLSVGTYQTTYTTQPSWVQLSRFIVYE